jgi:competence protein ComGF
MYNIRKDGGFTLLEVLICFSVILILTALFPILIKNLVILTEKKEGIHLFELEVFIQQATREVRTAKKTSVEAGDFVIINQGGQRVTYEFFQQKIRRRVDGTGHELLLHHVKKVDFAERANGAIFILEGSDDATYEFRVSAIPIKWHPE